MDEHGRYDMYDMYRWYDMICMICIYGTICCDMLRFATIDYDMIYDGCTRIASTG